MWKRVLAFSLVLVFVLGVTAQASPLLAPRVSPSLTFSGTTATCKASIRADSGTDAISMTVKLWHGTTCLKTWSASGTGFASLEKTAAVTRGLTYKLTLDFTINGVAQTQRSVTRTCP